MNEFSTTLRYLAMLEIIPRQPNYITVSQLIGELERRGYLVDKRTVERDLGKLEVPFGLSKERISW